MTRIDIYSGFLGAGKTTLIRKLIKEAYGDQKIVLIENEFGEIGIDSGFLKDAGVEIREMNSGCICCSLTGDFKEALNMVVEQFHPDRIVIEPSGVGKLSEVAAAVMATGNPELELGGLTTVVDASKCKMYLKNFGEFFNDQVESAHCIVLSRTGKVSSAKVEEALALLRQHNAKAQIITADWDALSGTEILAAVDGRDALSEELKALIAKHVAEEAAEADEDDDEDEDECCCGHHHHHHEEGEECCGHEHHHEEGEECCGHEHHHHEEGDECCHGHHHHEEGDECCHEHEEHEHHHHHHDHEDHDHEGHEHHHHHHHHHHGEHDADEVFTSWGCETAKRYTAEGLMECLKALNDSERFGLVLRAKGIVASEGGKWLHFDFTPEEEEVREGAAATTGLLCVIGAELKEDAVRELFGV